jgi:hypothetical protein
MTIVLSDIVLVKLLANDEPPVRRAAAGTISGTWVANREPIGQAAAPQQNESRITRTLKLTWPSVAALLRVHTA